MHFDQVQLDSERPWHVVHRSSVTVGVPGRVTVSRPGRRAVEVELELGLNRHGASDRCGGPTSLLASGILGAIRVGCQCRIKLIDSESFRGISELLA